MIDAIISPLREEYEKDRVEQLYTIEYFTNQYYDAFLDLTYRILFGRPPDADALEIYLPILREAKLSKIEILIDLRYSPEGIANGITIEGLQKIRISVKVTKRLSIKKLLQWIEYIVDFPNNAKKMANLEYIVSQKELEYREQTRDRISTLLLNNLCNTLAHSLVTNDTHSHSMKKSAIHQVVLGYLVNETVLLQAQAIQARLIESGYESEIFTQYPQINAKLSNDDGVIVHYSIGSLYIEKLLDIRGVKTLLFHGITPADYFELYNQEYAKLLEASREQIKSLNKRFDFVYSDSAFEAQSLIYMGYENVSILRPIIEAHIDKNNQAIYEQFQGSKIILFRGDIIPQNEILDMIEVLYWLKKIEPLVKMVILGEDRISGAYDKKVKSTLESYSLQNDFIVTGKISSDSCSSYYGVASLYLSLSSYIEEPIGLVTALYRALPIVALKSSTVEEIVGDSPLLIGQKQDKLPIAGLIALILRDDETKRGILAKQEPMREQFTQKTLQPSYKEFIQRLTNVQA